MSRTGFAAALLLAALSARAQVEIRPALALPAAPVVFALPPSAVLAPALTAAPLSVSFAAAVPAAAAAPAAPLPPAEARAATMSGALAEFARTDLKTASPGEASGAGEALMLRALGGVSPEYSAVSAGLVESAAPPLAASEPSGRRAQSKVYLLSQPLRETVRLDAASIVLHVVLSAAWEVVKDLGLYAGVHRVTGSVAAAAAVVVVEVAMASGMFTARTLADLGQRYWRRKLAVLKDLALTPGVSRVRVLTTGPVTYAGPLARSKDNTGRIFIEAEGELPQALGRFGAPIPLGDVEASRVRLVFVEGGGREPSAAAWTPTLKEILDGRTIPPQIAAAWRAAAKGSKSALKKALGAAQGKSRIEATLIGADGGERPLGSIVEGPAARKLAGLGHVDKLRAIFGLALPSRAIPISDSAVERPGAAREPGLAGRLRRAWRRLTGALIVVKKPG